MFTSRLAVPAALAALVATASAQGAISTMGLTILAPGGPNLWWVDQSINTLAWTCHTTTSAVSNFTVLIGNTNTQVLANPQAILSQVNNFDCSEMIGANILSVSPNTGYFIQLANPFNETDVWAQSDVFELKPLGSTYPASSATPTAPSTASSSGASGSSTGSASPTTGAAQDSGSPSPSPSTTHNAAASTKASLTGLAAVAAAAFGIIFA